MRTVSVSQPVFIAGGPNSGLEKFVPRGRDIVILTTRDGKKIDTESDLTAAERHILQKLFLWKSMANSLDQFRQKAEQALQRGWNDSGPVKESQNLKTIILDLEQKVMDRLQEEHKGQRHGP